MKRYAVFLSLFFLCVAFAQSSADDKQHDLLGQGRVQVGVSVGGGYGGYVGVTSQVTSRIQYFLKDGWSIMAEGRYTKIAPDFTYVGGGLSTRYYFLRGQRFALFGQLGATYGQSIYCSVERASPYQTLTSDRQTGGWQANTGLGAHYRLGKRWSLEATVERTQFQKASVIPDFSRWQGSVGINYRIK